MCRFVNALVRFKLARNELLNRNTVPKAIRRGRCAIGHLFVASKVIRGENANSAWRLAVTLVAFSTLDALVLLFSLLFFFAQETQRGQNIKVQVICPNQSIQPIRRNEPAPLQSKRTSALLTVSCAFPLPEGVSARRYICCINEMGYRGRRGRLKGCQGNDENQLSRFLRPAQLGGGQMWSCFLFGPS